MQGSNGGYDSDGAGMGWRELRAMVREYIPKHWHTQTDREMARELNVTVEFVTGVRRRMELKKDFYGNPKT